MLNRSISLKSSPQLARPASMRSKTAVRKERTAAQLYFEANRIKEIRRVVITACFLDGSELTMSK